MAKITVAKLFETVTEVDKRSQVALMQSEDSIQISEKTRTDLERLIATLRTDFTDIEQTQEIIRADTEEDNTITSSFFELQKSFDGLVGTVDILRTDLDNLYQAFYTSQIVRQEQLEKEEDAVFKEQDDLQKKRGGKKEGRGVLSNMIKGKKDPNQIQQDRKKQVKSLTKSVLRTLGLGALAGAAMGFGSAFGGVGGYGTTVTEQEGLAPMSLDASKIVADSVEAKAFIATVRETEGTAAESGYNTVYGGAVVPELTQMTLGELYEAIKQGGTDRLPARLGGGIIPFKKDKYNSSASGALQLMPETLKGMLDRGEFKEDDIFSPETQNKMIIQLAVNGGIDLENITPAELDKASGIWAGLSGAVHGQTTRTGEDSYRVYQQNVREAELGRFTTPDEPTKEEALRKVDETLKGFGGPGLPREEEEKEVKPQSQGNFLDFMMKGIFPDRSNQSLYTPAREDRQIASLQSNRSPSVSVMNLTQGIDGGTQVQQPRGSARSSVIPLSNTTNLAPVSLMTQNTFLT